MITLPRTKHSQSHKVTIWDSVAGPGRSHGQITSRTLAAEGERWAGAGNHPVVPHPESLAAQATYTESLLPGSGYGQNTFQALGLRNPERQASTWARKPTHAHAHAHTLYWYAHAHAHTLYWSQLMTRACTRQPSCCEAAGQRFDFKSWRCRFKRW